MVDTKVLYGNTLSFFLFFGGGGGGGGLSTLLTQYSVNKSHGCPRVRVGLFFAVSALTETLMLRVLAMSSSICSSCFSRR